MRSVSRSLKLEITAYYNATRYIREAATPERAFTGLHHFGVYVEDLEGTAKKCLENGCVPYDELPEDPGEKANYYRPKRSDKFKGPENALFDIADHPWIGAGPVK